MEAGGEGIESFPRAILPMKVLALDLSTSAGFAVLEGEEGSAKPALVSFGTIANEKGVLEYGDYPFCYLNAAQELAGRIWRLVIDTGPDLVVIEETNLGQNRYSQKILEFIHFAVLQDIEYLHDGQQTKVVYVSSSTWRKALGVHLTKEDKRANAKLGRAKRAAAEKGQKLDKKALGIKGKVNKKHVALRYVNDLYDLKLKVKDNDAADAICLGLSIFNNAPICDGR